MSPIPLPGRLSFYAGVQLVSVLFPGIVLLTELTVLSVHFTPHTGGDITYLISSLSRLQGAGLVMFVVLGLAGGFVLGYLGRELSFWCLGRIEAVRRKNGLVDWADISRLVGDDLAAECVRRHPIMRHLLPSDDNPAAVPVTARKAGGAHQGDFTFEVFVYAKSWLRRFSPTLSVDQTEAEINILAGIAVPVLVLGIDMVFLTSSTPLRILAPAVAIVIYAGTYHSALRLRRSEKRESIRNLALDVAMDCAAQNYGTTPAQTAD